MAKNGLKVDKKWLRNGIVVTEKWPSSSLDLVDIYEYSYIECRSNERLSQQSHSIHLIEFLQIELSN